MLSNLHTSDYKSMSTIGQMWASAHDAFATHTYTNFFIVVDLMLTIGWASTTVERGFSTFGRYF